MIGSKTDPYNTLELITQMLDLLRDGAWQAIGAFLTVATIAVSFLIYRWQRQRRALTYQVKSAYALLKSTEELHGRLSVQVDGIAVRNIDVMFLGKL